jgi:nitrogen fixation/metabolism regulation signal transduction histidine kinase
MVIPASQVIPDRDTNTWSIRKMEQVLARQGQIEPLQVKFHHLNEDGTKIYVTHMEDAWGTEIVLAARNLGWPTLLILITERYKS